MDITKCTGVGCNLRFACYRFKAIPSDYQSYFKDPPVENHDGVSTCGYFWETEEFKLIKDKNAKQADREDLD